MMQPGMMGQPMMGQPGMMPGQPMMGQPMMGQPMMGQPMMGQPMMGQPMMGQPMMGQPGMMPGQPMMGQPMMGQPMMGQPMMGQPMMGQPMMGAKVAHSYGTYQFVNGRPIYPAGIVAGWPQVPIGANMYIKSTWSSKREKKLRELYHKYMKDGVLTPRELQKCLKKFGYAVSDQHALQVLYTLDTNRDGRVDYGEFSNGIHQFVMVYPRTRKLGKGKKGKKGYKY